ncbi:MAG TPA: PrsW family glutamic-type intramembrane protease [Nitrospiraceae bacterium]|nr:PrsW family glutamic-type intramembrane protease [Nitrospiraceae bacterium]
MSYAALCAASFVPGLFWLWFFYKRDSLEPEPKRLLITSFFVGIGLGIPATFLEILFNDSLLMTVLIAPVIEETLKFGGVRFTVFRHPEFDEPLDGIIYTAAVALGFASMENLFYLMAAYLNASDTSQSLEVLSPFGVVMSVFVLRALMSVPSHVLYSGFWGYALGKAKFMDRAAGRSLVLKGFLLAIFCHGLFNFFASRLPQAALAELALVAILWAVILRKIAEGLKLSPHRAP